MNSNRSVTEELGAAAPSAFRDDGSLRSFADQVTSYEMDELATSEPLVVAASAHMTGLPQPLLDAVALPPLFPSLVEAGWEPRTMYRGINALPYIVEVSEEMIEALVVAWSRARERDVEGFDCCEYRYLSQLEGGGALACDNSTGECLVEQFPTTFDAKRWLSDDAISLSDLTQDEMRVAWADLGDVAVDDEGRLEEDWLCYPEGIDREEIWHDFDAAFEGGVHALMFPDDHVPSRNPTLSEAVEVPRQTDGCAGEQRPRDRDRGR